MVFQLQGSLDFQKIFGDRAALLALTIYGHFNGRGSTASFRLKKPYFSRPQTKLYFVAIIFDSVFSSSGTRTQSWLMGTYYWLDFSENKKDGGNY